MMYTLCEDIRAEVVPWTGTLIPQLRRDWELILSTLQRTPVFIYPECLEIAVRSEMVKLWCMLVIRKGKHTIALLPLQKRTPWTAEVCYHPMWEDTPPVLIDPLAAEQAWRGIAHWLRDMPALGMLSLGRRHHSAQLETIQQLACAANIFPCPRPVTADMWITLPRTWEEFLAELGHATRKTIHRREHQLRRDFGAEFTMQVYTGADIPQEALEELMRLHQQRWAGCRGSYFDAARNRTFYRELVRWAAGKGYAYLPILRINGRTIDVGTIFHIPGQDIAYAHCVARDIDALSGNYSAGTVMFTHVCRWAIEHGIRHLSLGVGSTYYKSLFGGREQAQSELFFAQSRNSANVLMKVDPGLQIVRRLPHEVKTRLITAWKRDKCLEAVK